MGESHRVADSSSEGSAGLECTTSSGSERTAPGVIQDRNESLTWVLGERMNQAVSEVPFELKKKKKKAYASRREGLCCWKERRR